MATPGQLMDAVSEATGTNRSTGESIYNQLRDDGEIPKGGRGINALQITSEHASKYLIAVCCSEHIKDAANAVRRYSALEGHAGFKDDEAGVPFTGLTWHDVASEFPRLDQLPAKHSFLDAFVALIDSYIDASERDASVRVTFGSPYPWAKASVALLNEESNRRVAIQYTTPDIIDDEGRVDDDPEFIAMIDPAKERQRRRFAKLGGDLRLTMEITHRTLASLGELLREGDPQ